MVAYSAKKRISGGTRSAWLAEANRNLTRHHTLFGRIESVSNDEPFPDHDDPLHDRPFRVAKFQAGYAWRMQVAKVVEVALGGTVAAFAKPSALDAAYGGHLLGYTLFAKFSLSQ
ncbi:MAG: hypothetical protein B7Z39_02975 [Novosphingobium sp. 12-64-8]|nr:MAG: hypothetical protein B7Z39_02975 [Novosphingobium sp. 12-64-8]